MEYLFINGRFFFQKVTGVQRYAIEVVKGIDKHLDNYPSLKGKVILIIPKNTNLSLGNDLKNIKILKKGLFNGHLWEQLVLPFTSRRGYLLNLCNTGPILKKRQFITIHDMSVYEASNTYSLMFKIWYKVLFKFLAYFSKKIITDSIFSKRQIQKYLGVPESKIKVVYLGKEHINKKVKFDNILNKYNIKKKNYVLAVSSLSPHKNFNGIIQAVQKLKNVDFDVVIAGGTNPNVFKTEEGNFPSFVKYLGYVSDSELVELYRNASCFIYPSLYEGFGLPPLEAMALGCPVIVSNKASLPEICGEAAVYCDPYNPADIAEKINLVMSNIEYQEILRHKGIEHSNSFSWDKCSKEILNIVMEVMDN